jgi:hypothetical protein
MREAPDNRNAHEEQGRGGVVDWSNERYVRLYTRDTDDWLALTWQAKAAFPLILRKVDRSGFLATKRGAIGIAAQTGLPIDVCEVAVEDLLRDGCMIEADGGFLLRNYIQAQEAIASGAQRSREHRERVRDRRTERTVSEQNVSGPERNVPEPQRGETSRNSVPSRAVPYQAVSNSKAAADETNFALHIDLEDDPPEPEPRKLTPAQELVVAANRATEDKFGPQTRPLLPNSHGAVELTELVTNAHIPLDFAKQSIVRQVQGLREPVKTMKYFWKGIDHDFASFNANRAASAAPKILPLDRKGGERAPAGSAPIRPEDEGVLCFACRTKETETKRGRLQPKHRPDCPVSGAIAQVGQ